MNLTKKIVETPAVETEKEILTKYDPVNRVVIVRFMKKKTSFVLWSNGESRHHTIFRELDVVQFIVWFGEESSHQLIYRKGDFIYFTVQPIYSEGNAICLPSYRFAMPLSYCLSLRRKGVCLKNISTHSANWGSWYVTMIH